MKVKFEEKTVESERGKTHYWISRNTNPNAPIIMFLHGLLASHKLYVNQLEEFSPRCTVLTWDAPVHGVSRPYKDFTMGNMLKELITLLDQESISKIIFVGQSAGGYLAQLYAKTYREQVEAVLTIGAPPCDGSYYTRSDRFWINQAEWMAHLYTDKILRKAMAKACGKTQKAYENMYEMMSVFDKNELCHLTYLAFTSMMKESVETSINCPIWLTVGESDQTGKVRLYNERMHKKEGYPLYIIPNAAHNANEDNPEEMNKIIWRFLEFLKEKDEA